jgi:hypothetical protein
MWSSSKITDRSKVSKEISSKSHLQSFTCRNTQDDLLLCKKIELMYHIADTDVQTIGRCTVATRPQTQGWLALATNC